MTTTTQPDQVAQTTRPIAELACPSWCTHCFGWDGECIEHTAAISLGIGAKDGNVEVNVPMRVEDTDVVIGSVWAYVGNGRDAMLSADQLRSMSAGLLQAADLMDKITAEVTA